MSLFLVGPGRTTLPIAILQYLEWKIDPTIAAVSVLQILLIDGGDAGDRSLRQDQPRGLRTHMARLAARHGVTKRYGEFHAVRDVSLEVAGRGVSGPARALRLWQDDDLAHHRRLRGGYISAVVRLGGHDVTRTPAAGSAMLVSSPPELCTVSTSDRGRERRLRSRDAEGLRADIAPRVAEALRLVRLGHLGERLPRRVSPADSSSVSRWRGRSSSSRTFCCSTSPCPISMPSCARRSVSRSVSCSASSG